MDSWNRPPKGFGRVCNLGLDVVTGACANRKSRSLCFCETSRKMPVANAPISMWGCCMVASCQGSANSVAVADLGTWLKSESLACALTYSRPVGDFAHNRRPPYILEHAMPDRSPEEFRGNNVSNQMVTIYADFNNRDGDTLSLSCNGTQADLERLAITATRGTSIARLRRRPGSPRDGTLGYGTSTMGHRYRLGYDGRDREIDP